MNPLTSSYLFFFFFNDTATTEIYTLSLHDALPICSGCLSESTDSDHSDIFSLRTPAHFPAFHAMPPAVRHRKRGRPWIVVGSQGCHGSSSPGPARRRTGARPTGQIGRAHV